MDLEYAINIGIWIHAAFGAVALLAGAVSIIAKKGGTNHKRSGKVFYYAMLVASISGIVVAIAPGHFNPFLFAVGIFSGYLTLSGYRALRFKRKQTKASLRVDYLCAYLMLITGFAMVGSGVYVSVQGNGMGTVLIVFGSIGLLNALLDIRSFKDLKTLRKKWLTLHIGKISGAYIAALTAFIVVNQAIPDVLGWLLPTVLGTIFIVYWTRKVRGGSKTTTQS